MAKSVLPPGHGRHIRSQGQVSSLNTTPALLSCDPLPAYPCARVLTVKEISCACAVMTAAWALTVGTETTPHDSLIINYYLQGALYGGKTLHAQYYYSLLACAVARVAFRGTMMLIGTSVPPPLCRGAVLSVLASVEEVLLGRYGPSWRSPAYLEK